MPDPLAAVTVVTCSYLHYARVLARALRRHHPELPLFVCLADRPDGRFDPRAEPFRVIDAEALPIEDWRRFTFQYTAFEMICALKSFAIDHVLALEGVQQVVYLDADMAVYNPLSDLARTLDECQILITPHLTAPLPSDGKLPDELAIRRAGSYNAGLMGLRRGPAASAFLAWWQEKMRRSCVVDIVGGLTCDQSWMDLVPGLFDGVRIERDPGCNLAYWNLPARRLEREAAGTLFVDGRPLVCLHWSGFDPQRPGDISVHQNRIRLADSPLLAELATDYVRQLDEAGRATCAGWEYGYDRLSDGTPIDKLWRETVRIGHPAVAGLADPFDASAERYYSAERDAARARQDRELARLHQTDEQLAACQAELQAVTSHPFTRWLARRDGGDLLTSSGPLSPAWKRWGKLLAPPLLLDAYRLARGRTPPPAPLPAARPQAAAAPDAERDDLTLPGRSLHELFPGITAHEVSVSVEEIFRPREMVLPLPDLLALGAICKHLRPRRIFEIGTYTGSSTAIMALHAPHAEIFTLDLTPTPEGHPWQVGSVFRGRPYAPRIEQLFGDSSAFDFSAWEGSIDLVFVDAVHTYEFVKRDSDNALRMVRPGGVIVWDDYVWQKQYPECAGVSQYLHELARELPVWRLLDTRLALHCTGGAV